PLPEAVKKSANPNAVRRAPASQAGKMLPDAVARPIQIAACGACGAKKGVCGACGAKKGACGACGAKKGACGACGPCGGGGGVSKACFVPRLAAANPCAAKKGACGACGAKKAGCGACGAKKSGCGACGAKKAGCGACGAKKAGCGACGAKKGACGACGAKKAGACGACGAKKGACGACGAKKGACGACGACGGAKPAAKLTDVESAKAYGCLLRELRAAYSKSGHGAAKAYAKWKRYNTVAFISETHGNRYVNNYANAKAKAYIKFEKVKRLPAGSVLAKDSFQVKAGGKLAYGPLFLMTKMGRGWSKASGDWKYAMIMPDGTMFGTTKGKGADKVKFCYQCHMAAADKDSLFFLPEKYRVRR
ncbi:MAG: cytochrome P460 family protein, partial [Alphaproteobacteria bacterium]|nr:cytochrome P460 family protein [Alphaproteobacteria bacterium]